MTAKLAVYPISKCHSECYKPTEGMTHQMDGAAGSSDNRLKHLGFMKDEGIARGAPFRGSSVAKKARGHASHFAIPIGDHGPPCGAGAA
jgi:hypothetical protein